MLNYPTTFIPQIYKKEIDNCNFTKRYLLFNVKSLKIPSLYCKSTKKVCYSVCFLCNLVALQAQNENKLTI